MQGELLRREGDPEDRRHVRLYLTSEGRSVWNGVQSAMMERATALARRLPQDERSSVLVALERLVEALGDEVYLPRSRGKGGCRCGKEGT